MVQCFHGVENHFVVQCPAINGMRMADQRGVLRVAGSFIQYRFKTANRAIEKKRADCIRGHLLFQNNKMQPIGECVGFEA